MKPYRRVRDAFFPYASNLYSNRRRNGVKPNLYTISSIINSNINIVSGQIVLILRFEGTSVSPCIHASKPHILVYYYFHD